MINEEWLRWAIAILLGVGGSAGVSIITSRVQVDNVNDRMDREMAQIREIFRNRDEVDRVTIEGVRSELSWIKNGMQDMKERMDRKFGFNEIPDPSASSFVLIAADVFTPPLPQTPRKLIFEDELGEMRKRLDLLIAKLKEGKLETEDEVDELYSLELDYEIKKGWQVWCEFSEARRAQCLSHLKRE